MSTAKTYLSLSPYTLSLLSIDLYSPLSAETPVVIVACADTKASPDWCYIDVAIAVENMVLGATGEGLGTCWVGSFDEDRVKALLKIPSNYAVVILLADGYAREKLDVAGKLVKRVRGRKKLEDIISAEEYGKPYKQRS